jgi:acetyltransferase-like isoleucine patch superfamily enzyme
VTGKYTIVEKGASIGKSTTILTHCYIYHDVVLGENCFVGHHATIRPFSKVGNGTHIGSYNQLEGYLEIGKDVRFHSDVHICQGSKIGDRVFIAPRTTLLNTLHPLCPKAKECVRAPLIENDVKIGANCTISPGVTIGKGSLIGSATNVIKDVPPFSVVIGNPGRVVKSVDELTCPYGLVERPYETRKKK